MANNGNGNAKKSWSDLVDAFKVAREMCRRIIGFKITEAIEAQVITAAAAHEDGDDKTACGDLVYTTRGIYNLVAAFFRNAPERFFAPRIDNLYQEGFDQDLIELVEARLRDFEKAIHTATESRIAEHFEERITTYNTLHTTLSDVPTEQAKRDANRAAKESAEKRAAREAKEAEDKERQRVAPEAQRAADRARRTSEADELRSLLD